jgi:hypothetical protein
MDAVNLNPLVKFCSPVFIFGDKGHYHGPALVQGIHSAASLGGPLSTGTHWFSRIGGETPERREALIVNNRKAAVTADPEIHGDHPSHPPGALLHIPEGFFQDKEVPPIFQEGTGIRLPRQDRSPDFPVNMAYVLTVFIPGPIG